MGVRSDNLDTPEKSNKKHEGDKLENELKVHETVWFHT